MRVEIADLGDWGTAVLCAEYDPEDDAIRVHAGAVATIAATLGAAEARRFVACAVAHERFHRANPSASEADAKRYALAETGGDAEAYARILRR